MTFVQFEYFIAAATARSFEEAAEEHHISQSALSQQIIKLEKELNVNLFRKVNRKNELTIEGQYFLSKVRPIVDRYKNLIASFSEKNDYSSTTELQLSLPASMKSSYLNTALSEFKKDNPLCNLCLHFQPFNHLGLFQHDSSYDICVKYTPVNQNLTEMELFLFSDIIYSVFSPAHPLAQLKNVQYEDLYPYILIVPFDPDIGDFININLTQTFSNVSFDKKLRLPADQVPEMIAKGNGYTFCNRIIAEKIQDYGLVCVPVCFSGLPVRYEMRLNYKTPVSDYSLALIRALKRNFNFPEDRIKYL